MNWRKEIDKPFDALTYTAAVILFLFSLYTHSFWIVFILVLLCMMNAATHYYFNHLIKNLRFINPPQKVRLFVGDDDVFSLELANDGLVPFFHGTMSFSIDDLVLCKNLEKKNFGHRQSNYSFSVGLNRREFKHMDIPVEGVQRGTAKFRSVQLTVRDWLGLGEIRLAYDPFIRTEIIVYPELKAVNGLDKIETHWLGTLPYLHSLNEDLTSPSGMRSYLPSDSFRRIHWKASAKTGELQTKVYEKTNGMNWVLLFQLNREQMSAEEMEREISCMAYVCRFATEHNISYSLFINIKIRGKGRILHLESESGRNQLSKALELLARISVNSLTLNARDMLAHVDRYRFQNAVMILFNLTYLDDQYGVFRKWQKQGHELYRIEHSDNVSAVLRLSSKKAVS